MISHRVRFTPTQRGDHHEVQAPVTRIPRFTPQRVGTTIRGVTSNRLGQGRFTPTHVGTPTHWRARQSHVTGRRFTPTRVGTTAVEPGPRRVQPPADWVHPHTRGDHEIEVELR